MTTLWPIYIYREDMLRRAWWLNTILAVVWGMDVVVGGLRFLAQSMWENQNPEGPDNRACNTIAMQGPCTMHAPNTKQGRERWMLS